MDRHKSRRGGPLARILHNHAGQYPNEELDAVVDSAVGKLGKEARLSGSRTASSPLGKGRTTRFESESDAGVLHAFLLEFHP